MNFALPAPPRKGHQLNPRVAEIKQTGSNLVMLLLRYFACCVEIQGSYRFNLRFRRVQYVWICIYARHASL